jgi:hypothetical protein
MPKDGLLADVMRMMLSPAHWQQLNDNMRGCISHVLRLVVLVSTSCSRCKCKMQCVLWAASILTMHQRPAVLLQVPTLG